MLWVTGIDLNVFNAIKAAVVFLILKPLTVYCTCILASLYATQTLHKYGEVRFNSLGICSSMFDGLVLSRPTKRKTSVFLLAIPLLLITAWIGTISEVLFEYGINSQTESTHATMLLTTTSGNSDNIVFSQGSNLLTDRVAEMEMSCEQFNNLTTYVDVYTSTQSSFCGTKIFRRTLCASGRDLLNEECKVHQLPHLEFEMMGDAYFPEHDLSLAMGSRRWEVESDHEEEENGYVTFTPYKAQYGNRTRLRGLSNSPHVRNLDGLHTVHCGSGSRLNSALIPGKVPFQVCIWRFEKSLIITNADWIVGIPRSDSDNERFEGHSRSGQTVREFTGNFTELQISTTGRWISISSEERDNGVELSKRDIMTSLSIARDLVRSNLSNEDDDDDAVETFEMGLWASASMALRVIERALIVGISLEREGFLMEQSVVMESRQIATVDLKLLAQYVGSILVFVIAVVASRALATYPVRLHVTVEGLLDWWAREKGGDTGGSVGKRDAIVLVSNERSMRVSVPHRKEEASERFQAGIDYEHSIESESYSSETFS